MIHVVANKYSGIVKLASSPVQEVSTVRQEFKNLIKRLTKGQKKNPAVKDLARALDRFTAESGSAEGQQGTKRLLESVGEIESALVTIRSNPAEDDSEEFRYFIHRAGKIIRNAMLALIEQFRASSFAL